MIRDFSSDNVTGVAPEILAAVARANAGTAHSYGDDEWTHRLTRLAQDVFECDLAIYPVATGTAANALALAAMMPAHGGVYCHETAHIEKDECGAPEFFTGGAKLLGLAGAAGKIAAGAIGPVFEEAMARGIHQVRPSAISISQATEWGTVYARDEIAALAEFGRSKLLHLHMDGARFANALVYQGCTPAQATWQAGVDVLSFGATKNGAMAAEAVVFFDLELAAEFEYRRKRAGQLLSKMRFFSAQLVAYLEDGLWLRHAGHANRLASRLAEGLLELGIRLTAPVQANEVFPAFPEGLIAGLMAEGFGFYRWPAPAGFPQGGVVRLVTAWNQTVADVDGLLAAVARQLQAGA